MTIRTALISGIAGLVAAAAVSFCATAQERFPAPTSYATTEPSQMMSSGPNYRPSVRYVAWRHRHYAYTSSHDSTPAEKAATDRLNRRQLADSGAAL